VLIDTTGLYHHQVNASIYPSIVTTIKRTTAKKAKSKARRTSMINKQRRPKAVASKALRKMPNQVVEASIEATVIDVIKEPVPGAVDVTEEETIETANSMPALATRIAG
jgi:hypothetical protein